MTLTKIIIVFTSSLAIQVLANNNCENLATLIYEDLACEPTLGPDGCPSSYDCSHRKPKEGYCLFKGVYYKDEEFINGTDVCNSECHCFAESGKKSKIGCAEEYCIYGPLNPECYITFNKHDCCPSEPICPEFDDRETYGENNGKTYKEGDKFFPTNSCVSCICGEGYKGVYEETFCTRIQCDVEIENSEQIDANCAPVYLKNDIKCCPTMYICPEHSVVEDLESGGEDSTVKCKFGTREFNVKDKFILKYSGWRFVSCSCSIPPLVTCEL